MAAVCVSSAIDNVCNINTGIKWVNDVYYKGKKLCGILCESSIDNDKLKYVIVGIGINIIEPKGGYPDEIKDKAISILGKNNNTTINSDTIKDTLLYEIIKSFIKHFNLIENKSDNYLFEKYKEKMIIMNQFVSYEEEGTIYKVKVEGINKDYGLIVSFEDGRKKALGCGEVSIIS
jgi:BirA family biotin operon repressor/biotin-[acetyl-CoA-carboxylase] ligase